MQRDATNSGFVQALSRRVVRSQASGTGSFSREAFSAPVQLRSACGCRSTSGLHRQQRGSLRYRKVRRAKQATLSSKAH